MKPALRTAPGNGRQLAEDDERSRLVRISDVLIGIVCVTVLAPALAFLVLGSVVGLSVSNM